MKNPSGVKLIAVIALVALALLLSVRPLSNNINLGLDLQGGAQVVLQAVPDEGGTVSQEDMQHLVSVLENRVNELGVSEPVLQIEGSDRIIVELAGVDNPDEAISLIGKTAQLEFRDPYGNVILTGADLEDSYASINQGAPAAKQNEVVLKFTNEGAEKFFNATATFVGQIIYIYLDNEVISQPTVDEPIAGGTASISGGFATFEEASNLAALLRGGALPVDLDVLSKQTVGPTLGADSLDKSLNAGMIGLILLFAFMILYYKAPGVWACISLFVYTLIVIWVQYWIGATMTLTSIAGFILSIGMAVDANIIIFERIREELYHGKSLRASIETGFKRAFMTVFDSNMTTLISALVLLWLGTGTIKGFALTLTIGLVASMFTAITFTRGMLRWMSDIDFLAKKNLYASID